MLRETSKEFSDYASLRQVQKKPLNLRRLLNLGLERQPTGWALA